MIVNKKMVLLRSYKLLPHNDSSKVQWISADDDLSSRMDFFDEFVNSFFW